ncbi:expressed unknown protein [Seminavis robusta]|uniref:Uncharacterized protein n=1 Tax=Seminavis robusta TaxID=568900 RepID=A0A9N8EQG6_9STRA|nr:expressed unknown protein [Seminavis robusta]|eukprot:Sro1395_g269080.1 n/a (375) ;mRNA; r:20698-22017
MTLLREPEYDHLEHVELVPTSRNNIQKSTNIHKRLPKPTQFQLCCVATIIFALLAPVGWLVLLDTIVSSSGSSNNSQVKQASRRDIVDRQIANFRNGSGSIVLNYHITHHAGTTVCADLGHTLKHPSFACMGPNDDIPAEEVNIFPKQGPWGYNETDTNIKIIQKNFHLVSWELRHPHGPEQPQNWDTNWEHPNLVSLLVMREPISRSLAGDGVMAKKYPGIWEPRKYNASIEEYWEFAHEEYHNNNYALRILSDIGCCNGSDTNIKYLEEAKEVVKRFTFVVDQDCLSESLEKVAEILGIENAHNPKSKQLHRSHKPLEERIPYPEVLDYLKDKNKLDIELYEWSKERSVVNCRALEADRAAAAAKAEEEKTP